ECEVWIPAARPDVITEDNVERLNTKLVVSGANIPVTESAEKYLHEKGILCIPDFIANAGGVVCAAMEYQGTTESVAMQTIEEKLRRNTRQVLDMTKNSDMSPRQAAMNIALERVHKAMGCRRWSVF
ncbi:MAG: Glu/Leu/Phe/Val dehydrogenase, partial [Gammaproteobacteria bacterium]|nr:Glu/Leu/Phe/Val dehydrogenase [Gammaproteobacteria bacterium]